MKPNRLTPEEQAVLDTSRRMYMFDTSGNRKAWRKAESEKIKSEARARKIIDGIIRPMGMTAGGAS